MLRYLKYITFIINSVPISIKQMKWGLVCSIVCESYFEVLQHLTLQSSEALENSSEGSTPPKNIIRSVYEDYVMIEATAPISPFSFSSFFNGGATNSSNSEQAQKKLICTGLILGRDIDTGTVSLSKCV